MRLVRTALANRAVVLVLAALWMVAGLWAFTRLPIDAVPDVTNVQVQINTNAPGLAPLEVESQITFPIEQAMTGLPDLAEVRSLSKYGLSQVTVVFEDGVDLYFARQLAFERVQEARGQIPADLGEPRLGPISSGLGEIYQYAVVGEPSLMERRTLQDWTVKRQLRTVRGITEVNSFGGFERQYQVLLEPDRLRAYRVSVREVFQALATNNRNAGGGYIEHQDEQYLVRGQGLASSPAEIEGILVREVAGVPVRVGDLGRVVEGPALRQGAVTMNGQGETVIGIVMMLIGENSRTVSRRVDARVQELNGSLPQGVRLVPFYDRTQLVDRTLATVARNLAEGAALVVLVLVPMLGNLRAALIVAVSIPMAMLFAVICMLGGGVSGNLMSLGAVDFGLIVDGAVVMVENAVRRLTLRDTLESAAAEVIRPIVFGVGIIALVYLPILTLTGMEGKMFRPMALTVAFALAGSLLLTLTLIPVLCSLFLKPGHAEHDTLPVRLAQRAYRPALRWAVDRPGVVGGAAVLAFLAGLAGAATLGSEFLPRLDEGAVAIQTARLPSVSLSRSLDMSTRVEKALLEFPEVRSVVSKTGRPDIATDPMGVELSDVVVDLVDPSSWRFRTKEELVEAMGLRLAEIPGMTCSFSQPVELRVAELISGVRSDVALKLFGEDLERLGQVARQVAARLRTLRGARDVRVEQIAGLPYLEVQLDREALARHGLSVDEAQELLEVVLGQRPAGMVLQGEKRFPLTVGLTGRQRRPEDVKALPVILPGGETVPLGRLARIASHTGLAQVTRENGQRRVVVEANVRGRDLVGFVAEARRAVADLIPSGVFVSWGGQFENYARARDRLALVVPLALGLIFFMLYLSLGSGWQAALIFCNVPLAITGGVAALLARGLPFSISAGVGFIALCGVAVLNGLVLISSINGRRTEGRELASAVLLSCQERLRPVLTTALVAGLGFFPMAFSGGAGAEVQRPLATVVIGGLVTSTLLTLLVLPSLYILLERRPAG